MSTGSGQAGEAEGSHQAEI